MWVGIIVNQKEVAWLFPGAVLCNNATPAPSATTEFITVILLLSLVLLSLEDCFMDHMSLKSFM